MTTHSTRSDETFPSPVPEEVFSKPWQPPKGIFGFFSVVQNQPIGLRFIGVSLLFFILGGINALLMRTQLAVPENTFLGPETYNQLFTMHGSTMMFLVTIPMIEGIATLVLPQMLGSRELPFPRLTSFAFWSFVIGGITFYASFIFQAVPEGGWTAYTPLTNEEWLPGHGMDFWLLGLNVAEIGAIAGAFEIIVAFFKMRAPGMSLNRVPLFAWALLVMAFMMIFGFTPLIVGSFLLEFDRAIGTNFYRPEGGGDPLLWQHIFWIFGHPDVYIQFIPATGIISSIIPVFSQRKLVAHTYVIIALLATGFLSFGLWVHHMFTTGLPELSMSFFSAASMLIAIPSGVQIFAWTMTIFTGKPRFDTPFLFAIGFLINFVLGGLTGVMVASVPFDTQVHDTYFVVAHFHYVLIGGVVFPLFAGLYYWAPKFINKVLDERLGKINFWLIFIGFNLTFFPMHLSGFQGMPRRVYTYDADLGIGLYNLLSTIGAYIIALGVITFVANVIYSMRAKATAPDNPWQADSLEWLQPTPTPQYGFRTLPIVRSRYPLWDQESMHAGEEQHQVVVEALANYPYTWRAQLVTSTLDAEPEEVFRVAGPSIWPFVAALGTMGFSFFLIFRMVIPAIISEVISGIALILWHSEDFAKVTRNTQEDEKFEYVTGVPVRAEGSRSVARWGTWLTIITLATALLTLIMSYLYLRLNTPQWPPMGLPAPDLVLPVIVLVMGLAGAAGMAVAVRGVAQNDWGPLRLGLGISVLFGIAYLILEGLHLRELGFTWRSHAYGSAFWVLAVFTAALVLAGVVMSGVTLFWTLRATDSPQRHWSTNDIARYWYFAAGSAILVFIILYIVPYVY